jgi:uncharacterized protein (DUF58 family)
MTAGETGSVADRSLTRRGWVAVAAVVGCVVLALAFGRRSLDAVVLPLVLAVLAAVVATRRASPPTVDRRPPAPGHAGDGGEVTLVFDVATPTAGVVRDRVGEGLSAATHDRETTITDEPVTYRVDYDRRGVHEVGPLSVEVRDVLGLAATRFEYSGVDRVTVYPRLHDLRVTRSRLVALAGAAPDREREEFDRLREYEPGDDLRDVHWRSSAKRPAEDLVVKEFLADDDVEEVVVAVEAAPDRADVAAEVAASLVVHLLSAGLAVGLAMPDGRRSDPVAGPQGRRHLLERLAVFGPGELSGGAREAAIHVDARGEPTVRVGDFETGLDQLLADGDAGEATPDTGDGESAATAASPRAAADGGRAPREGGERR